MTAFSQNTIDVIGAMHGVVRFYSFMQIWLTRSSLLGVIFPFAFKKIDHGAVLCIWY
jgi:hypothetical protein